MEKAAAIHEPLKTAETLVYPRRKVHNACAAGGSSQRLGQKVEKQGGKVEEFHLPVVFTLLTRSRVKGVWRLICQKFFLKQGSIMAFLL